VAGQRQDAVADLGGGVVREVRPDLAQSLADGHREEGFRVSQGLLVARLQAALDRLPDLVRGPVSAQRLDQAGQKVLRRDTGGGGGGLDQGVPGAAHEFDRQVGHRGIQTAGDLA
jgi:hypothetical protein